MGEPLSRELRYRVLTAKVQLPHRTGNRCGSLIKSLRHWYPRPEDAAEARHFYVRTFGGLRERARKSRQSSNYVCMRAEPKTVVARDVGICAAANDAGLLSSEGKRLSHPNR